MKLRNRIKSSVLLSLLLILPGFSQDKQTSKKEDITVSEKKETVIVTANKNPTELREVGKSYTIITGEDIEKSNHHNLVDILKRVPGLHISQTGVHGEGQIRIRGQESYYTKVLLNGVSLEDSSSTRTSYGNIINNINLENVERIEIVRGSQSTLYGSDAIGGIINIITKKGGEDAFNGSIRQEFGTDKYNKSTLSLYGTYDALNYSLLLGHESQNSISTTSPNSRSFDSDGDDYRNLFGELSLSYQANENIEFGLYANGNKNNSEIDPGESFDEFFLIRPYLTLDGLFHENLETTISYSHADVKRINSVYSNRYSQSDNVEIKNTLYLSDWNTFTFGGEYTRQRNYSSASSAETVRYKEFYVQEQLSFADTYFLTFGGRFSHHSVFGSHFTYQIAPSIYIEETDTRLFASYGTGYRAPSTTELFSPEITYPAFGSFPALYDSGGDESFDPETSKSFDIGFEQGFLDKTLQLGATYFYNENKNLISGFYNYDPVLSTAGYAQTGFTRTYGLETFIQYDFSEQLFAKFNYTRTHTEYDRAAGEARAPRVPKDSFNLLVSWNATDKLNIDAELNYYGNRYSLHDNRDPLDSYYLVNLSGSYQINKRWKVFAKIHNLFDEEYELVSGYNTYGRSLYAGFEFKF